MEEADPTVLEALVPYWPGIATLIGFLIVGAFAAYNRRKGNVEAKAPSASELWQQQARQASELDIERRMRRWFEDAFWALVRAFTAYIDRVKSDGSRNLFAAEKRALEARPPDIDQNKEEKQ